MRLLSLLLMAVISFSSLASAAGSALAKVRGTSNPAIAGQIKLNETENGLQLQGQFVNLPPGDHGFHVHQNGSCSDGGKGAGGHFNPYETEHGHLLHDGLEAAHAGDLGNLTADQDGRATVDLLVKELTLSEGPTNVLGRAIIVHEKADDFGQPTGNAGGRIACGIITQS